ncbi:MAG TPA: IS1634 family transposase [Candidatus Acidoferrales bacterium]|nr:IS1634 family transposase [Candidatus Acidoferrales bacterium]
MVARTMFLRAKVRKKDGKQHRYFSVVENRRVGQNQTVQRTVLYLGEINDSQEAIWRKTLQVFDETHQQYTTLSLFPEDREIPAESSDSIQVKLSEMELRRPRAFGNCWLGCELWRQLRLEEFWEEKLAEKVQRETVSWAKVLQLLVVNRLIDPGSEFRVHRQWFDQSAMGELLQTDFAVAEKDRLYRCLDRLLEHKAALFQHLRERWQDLFQAQFDVLLYDLTSTYIEGEGEEIPKAKYGYSRDQRFDCKQVVIALVITPEGFPLAYEVLEGNTSDRTTLRGFLEKIESSYGKARRVWVMDRGIPTEAVLEEMRTSNQEIFYLVGTPRSKVRQYEKKWLDLPWQKVRESVEVKLFAEAGELYVLAKSEGRRMKERAMRRKKLARLLRKLRAMQRSGPRRDQLLLRIGAARKEAGSAFRFLQMQLPGEGQAVTRHSFQFRVDRAKLIAAELQDGHYLLRSNLVGENPTVLWERYVQLAQIEAAFKAMKSELGIRPLYHQLGHRVEAHILVAFLAYCLLVTLKNRLQVLAPGLTPKAVLEKLATIQMLDVWLPTTDGRWLVMPRFTQPEAEQAILLHKLKLELPQQPPPRITACVPEFPPQALSL